MSQSGKPKVIAVVGPTASGKTALSLAIAERFNGEIIACDSRTVYRHFDIGTAKPSAEEQARIPHHAIDVVEPDETYTVAQFADESRQTIASIIARGKLPIVAGGTGFYARALLEGLVLPSVSPNEELRDRLQKLADDQGNHSLHERLSAIDPETAARVGINDRFRIIRALEVYEATGIPMSLSARREPPPFDVLWLGLTANDRSVLHKAIAQRMDVQMECGLWAETEALYQRYGAHQKLMHTVNYKQLVQVLEGKLDLQEALKQAVHHNVQLARRQLIWFRANQAINWLAIDALSRAELIDSAAKHIMDAIA
jgi:tRNA dimethylallyltransferase